MLLVLSSLAIAQDARAQSVELISVSEPVYPKDQILPGVEARVEFQATITSAGLVENIKVLVSSGFPPLDKAGEESLETARFKPLVDKEGKADLEDCAAAHRCPTVPDVRRQALPLVQH